MGYTHYWDRKKDLNPEQFKKVVKDFKKLLPVFELIGIKLANSHGKGNAQITNKLIKFNGLELCGHTQRNLGITWPSENAKGIASVVAIKDKTAQNTMVTQLTGQQQKLNSQDSDVDGKWYAGLKLNARTCGGDCSHESVYFPQKLDKGDCHSSHDENEKLLFNCTKTAYKPYDLAVNCFLIIAKEHFKDDIKVYSDGGIKQWVDAMEICQRQLKYGLMFKFDDEDEDED